MTDNEWKYLNLRLDGDDRLALEELSRADRRSMTQEVAFLIRQEAESRGIHVPLPPLRANAKSIAE